MCHMLWATNLIVAIWCCISAVKLCDVVIRGASAVVAADADDDESLVKRV